MYFQSVFYVILITLTVRNCLKRLPNIVVVDKEHARGTCFLQLGVKAKQTRVQTTLALRDGNPQTCFYEPWQWFP